MQILSKVQKRNKARLIEIESKENINKFWISRLKELKHMRENEMMGRLEKEEKKMEWILKLQKSEEELLKEIKKTEEMESQLLSMMHEEKSMLLNSIANPQQPLLL